MTEKSFTTEQKLKLKNFISEGVTVMRDIKDLRESLNDTLNTVAKELDLKPKSLRTALRTAYKADMQERQEELTEVEIILDAVGKNR